MNKENQPQIIFLPDIFANYVKPKSNNNLADQCPNSIQNESTDKLTKNSNNENNNNLDENDHNNKNKDKIPKDIERRCQADCLRRKLKHFVLEFFREFINKKISKENEIKKIEYSIINNIKIADEKIFMDKSLGDIFSNKVSERYKKNVEDKINYNKNIIANLRYLSDDLNNLLEIKFIDCLEHFIGKNINEYLTGMKTFKDVKLTKENNTKEYKENLEYYALHYRELVLQSNPRNVKASEVTCIEI